MRWEAGVTSIQYPYKPRWTGKIVDAPTKEEAEGLFTNQGFYRNLVVREETEGSRFYHLNEGQENN